MAKIYEHTTAQLMVEMAAQLVYPASRSEVIAWFAEHYPELKASTVRAHITGMTANDRNRHHFAWLARQEPVFTRNPDGSLSAFEASEMPDSDEDADADVVEVPPLEFALETFLEHFLLTNWEGIDWGRRLEIWESETDELGHQLATPVGRINSPAGTRPPTPSSSSSSNAGARRRESSDRSRATPAGCAPAWRSLTSPLRASSSRTQDLQLAYAVSAVPGPASGHAGGARAFCATEVAIAWF